MQEKLIISATVANSATALHCGDGFTKAGMPALTHLLKINEGNYKHYNYSQAFNSYLVLCLVGARALTLLPRLTYLEREP